MTLVAPGVNDSPYKTNFRPGVVGDFLSREHVLAGGIKLDPAAFSDIDLPVVTVGAAGAAIGAVSIPVDALPEAVNANTLLNFGTLAPVTVKVDDADVNATETSFGVDALSGPIPAGTILRFGAGVYARLSAAADTGDVTLTVEALATDIANDAEATFAGGTKLARVTTAAAKGAATIAVDELQFALVDNETATYAPQLTKLGSTYHPKRVAAYTLVGLTNAELEAAGADGVQWGPAADADDVVRLLAYDVQDVDDLNDADVLRPGTLIYVNFLPGWADLSNTLKAKLRSTYECSVATPGQEVAAS